MSIHELSTRSGDALGDPSLAIAMGAVVGASVVSKFGTNELVGTAVEDIWEQGGKWVPLPAATLVEVASTSTLDVMTTGTGAWSIVIEGYDANYLPISETIELNGQTPVPSTLEYLYINRAYIGTILPDLQAAGTLKVNQGEIRVADDSTAWSGGDVVTVAAVQAMIEIDHGQTQQMIWTVPGGHTAFVTGGYVVTSANQDTEFRVMTWNRTTNAIRVAFEGTISNSEFIKNNNPAVAVSETTTIYIEAKNASSASTVSAGLDIIVVDNVHLQE